jgi:methionyl-tRNA synthetase
MAAHALAAARTARCPAQVSAESGHPVEMLAEPNYLFRLSALQQPLLQWLDANPEAILPKARYNEVRGGIEAGLQDLSVSRLRSKIGWAITVPEDPDHSIYVWLDALANYLTVSGYPWTAERPNCTWPAAVQIVGKDILRFHAVYWPAFLLAAGLPLPGRIVAHAHWTVGRVKMSKSLGNTVTPADLLDRCVGPCPA